MKSAKKVALTITVTVCSCFQESFRWCRQGSVLYRQLLTGKSVFLWPDQHLPRYYWPQCMKLDIHTPIYNHCLFSLLDHRTTWLFIWFKAIKPLNFFSVSSNIYDYISHNKSWSCAKTFLIIEYNKCWTLKNSANQLHQNCVGMVWFRDP